MHSETSSADITMDLHAEKADAATAHIDREKNGKILEGDHHVVTRRILWKLDIR
jgi:hypothetical protein